MTKINEIPRKTKFSGVDGKEWGLFKVDFKPFEYQDDFAENINKIANLIGDEDLLETLQQAKDYACSTVILNDEGHCQRVYFENPKQLENFLVNYNDKSS